MFREIDAECYIMVDADDTYPAENAPEMVRLVLEKHADMVVGDRLSSTYKQENKRPFHSFGNEMVWWTINHLFDTNVLDIMTGYRAFSYNFVKTYPVLSRGFEIETEMTIHAIDRKMQIETIPVQYRDRPVGSTSKLNTFKDGAKVLKTIFKMYRSYRPLRFFGSLGIILAMVSVAFFIPVWLDYMETGLVARFPTLIVCGIVMVMALLLFVAGVILASMRDKDKMDFEFRLIQVEEMKKSLK